MKIRHMITAAAVFCSLSVSAYATEEMPTASEGEAAESIEEIAVQAEELSVQSVVAVSEGEASNVDTGVGGVAAFVGIITLAGAVVVISRKKS